MPSLTIDTATATEVESTTAPVTELASAIAAVTAGTAATEEAGGYLFGITRDAYARHAAMYSRTVDGVLVMPDSFRGDVLSALWNEAGYAKAPTAKDRTKGERTFAQYASRFAKVATSIDYGVGLLAEDDSARDALTAIKDSVKADSDAAKVTRTAVMVGAFSDWVFGLSQDDRDALTRVESIFTRDSVARIHGATFAAALAATVKGAE